MRKLHYTLILIFIYTGYLFSQSAKNEILEEYTITLANTVVVTEIDTVVVEESVSELEEKKDLSNYSFYNDYLDYIKKTNSMDDIGDTNVFIPKREMIGIFLLETGAMFSNIPTMQIVAFSIRVPISNYFHILLKHARAFEKYRYYSFMVGYSFFVKKSIIDISVGPSYPVGGKFHGVEPVWFSVTDIAYHYRVSQNVVFSATMGSILVIAPNSLSVGIGLAI